MKYTFKDQNTSRELLSAELPEGFAIQASLSDVMKGINRDIEIRALAVKVGV